MTEKQIILLSRDCFATMVPAGARIMLHEGTEVQLTQSLGNSYTVNVYGNLARIEGQDADALGFARHDPLADLPQDASLDEQVTLMLKTVFDPEIPVNIVDLGLVYNQLIKPCAEDSTQFIVTITMTLTAPGCGMGPVIAADAQQKVELLPRVSKAEVEIVFDPPWNQDMMSDPAKLELGLF